MSDLADLAGEPMWVPKMETSEPGGDGGFEGGRVEDASDDGTWGGGYSQYKTSTSTPLSPWQVHRVAKSTRVGARRQKRNDVRIKAHSSVGRGCASGGCCD